jgi:hypothetical protein
VTGSPSFSTSNLNVTEAGNNFTSTINSTSNSSVTVSNASTSWWWWSWNTNWSVSVYKVDISWNSNLNIYIKRAGDGSGSGSSVSGGTTYIVVSSTGTSFFSGAGNRSNIPISYQISGISMTVPADNYSTTIYYTISQTW